jgi:hypothetical protein
LADPGEAHFIGLLGRFVAIAGYAPREIDEMMKTKGDVSGKLRIWPAETAACNGVI